MLYVLLWYLKQVFFVICIACSVINNLNKTETSHAFLYAFKQKHKRKAARLFYLLFSSPEPKAHGELIEYQSSRRLCVCLSVNIFKLEYL